MGLKFDPIKQRIFFPPIFSQFDQLIKKTNFLLVQNSAAKQGVPKKTPNYSAI